MYVRTIENYLRQKIGVARTSEQRKWKHVGKPDQILTMENSNNI